MTKRLLSLLAVLVLGITTPLIAQSEDPTQQTPAMEEPTQAADEQATGDEPLVDDPATLDDERELPRTASPFPLLALLGASSGAAAFALRRRR
ncbi:MAG: hypothetical protein HYU52_13930 [Acidobacteria bacterium]|nr:hypothetical protein [Acidobacteriota bacterium]